MTAGDSGREAYTKTRTAHWDSISVQLRRGPNWGRYYHSRLAEIYRFLIPGGQRVLEIGCGQGDLLAALNTPYGTGIDFSEEMIASARQRHPGLRFIHADVFDFDPDETFDFIILSDVINDLWDVQEVIRLLRRMSGPHTRVIFNYFSHLWELPLLAAQKAGLAMPILPQNWLTPGDLRNLLYLEDFDVIRSWQEILCPVSLPLLTAFCNRYLCRIWPFREFSLTNFTVARPRFRDRTGAEEPVVSVVVPARNEAGNIARIFERTPEMGAGTEIIFVEGHSSDNTFETIEREIKAHPERRASLFRQTGSGKGDAVRLGFSMAEGGVLMILDADLTVAPEDLPKFYDAVSSGRAEFVNGVRLVYPMERQAMRFFNLIGNKFFSLAFSWLLGQDIKDTLCGTKVLTKNNYDRILAQRSYFGDFDPFGDFDLIFGAAKLNLKISDLPVRYRERTYGSTNIHRWSHGWLLLKMTAFAASRIKFI